jgi:hypothetical protein
MSPTISNDVKLYYEERLRALGITEQINAITTPRYDTIDGVWTQIKETKTLKAFELNEKGIQINYYLPTGYPIDWRKEGTKNVRNFYRTRLFKERTYEKDGKTLTAKYDQEKGSPLVPFLTPGVIQAYTQHREIETLVLIEGEIKAFKAWMDKSKCEGMDNVEFVGIPGIHGFYGGDTNHKREINEIIQQIILDCKVKNIVLLLDADTLTVKWEEDKDLLIRPRGFANAVTNFRNSLHLLMEDKTVSLSQIYFMHLKTKFNETAKGLDDLLMTYEAKRQAIMDDLLNFHFAKTYFDGLILTDGQMSGVEKYFGIKGENDFYALYKEFIGSRPFYFRKNKYEWSGEELKYVKSEESDRFARIGINWIKRVRLPNHRGLMEEKIEKWSVAEIKRDYHKHIAEQMINRDIPRYDGFFSLPCWDPKLYRRTIHGCYNLMEPLIWDPKPGRIDFTLGFIKHLFQGKGNITWNEKKQSYEEVGFKGDQFTLAMDYLTILHQFPTQKTFVPVLVSKDQGTGKSTFLEWLCMVYNGNGTILNNQRFQMNFNGHWASKFIIGLDEGFLDVDKKAEREKLKQMVTANEMFLELKGVDVKTIPYYGHLIICSNDADNVMKMDEEDTRWFVVKVKRSEKKDPDLVAKLKAEIEAWVNFLSNRKIFHPKVDRLWFDPKDFETDQMRKIIEVTKARIDSVVENWIKDIFLTYKVDDLRINRKTLLKHLNNPEVSKYRIDEKDLKYYLEEKKKMEYKSPGRCKVPYSLEIFDGISTPTVRYIEEVQRHYYFIPEEWLTPAEYEEYRKPFDIERKEEKDQKEANPPSGEFKESVKLDNKQYKQEDIWDQKKGPLPF